MGHRRVHDVLETRAMPAFYLIPQRMRDSNASVQPLKKFQNNIDLQYPVKLASS